MPIPTRRRRIAAVATTTLLVLPIGVATAGGASAHTLPGDSIGDLDATPAPAPPILDLDAVVTPLAEPITDLVSGAVTIVAPTAGETSPGGPAVDPLPPLPVPLPPQVEQILMTDKPAEEEPPIIDQPTVIKTAVKGAVKQQVKGNKSEKGRGIGEIAKDAENATIAGMPGTGADAAAMAMLMSTGLGCVAIGAGLLRRRRPDHAI